MYSHLAVRVTHRENGLMKFDTADITAIQDFAEFDYIVWRINIYLIIESNPYRTFSTPIQRVQVEIISGAGDIQNFLRLCEVGELGVLVLSLRPRLGIVNLSPETEMQRWWWRICGIGITVLFVAALNLVVKDTRLRAYIFSNVPVVGADALLVAWLEK